MAVSSRSSSPNPSPPKGKKGKANATGFVQKLCEMVNGAPDDVVSVSSLETYCSLVGNGWSSPQRMGWVDVDAIRLQKSEGRVGDVRLQRLPRLRLRECLIHSRT